MSKIKIGLIGLLSLSVMACMAGPAQAALTLGALTIASDSTLAIDGAAGSALTIGDAAQTGAINIGTSSATLSALNLANGAGAATVNIAINDTAADDINIGSAKDDVDITGASDIVAGTTAALTITAHAASTWSTNDGELLITNTGADEADDIAITSTTLGDVTITAGDDFTLSAATAAAAISIADDANTHTITIGTGDAVQTISIGTHATPANVIAIGGAASDVDLAGEDIALTSADDIQILSTTAAGIINIGTGDDGYVFNVGTNNTAADDINIGSALDAVSIVGDDWSVTDAGVADFASLTVDAGAGLDNAAAGALLIGAAAATSVEIADAGVTTDIQGPVTVLGGIDTAGAAALTLGAATATSVAIGATGITTAITGKATVTDTITAGKLFVSSATLNDGAGVEGFAARAEGILTGTHTGDSWVSAVRMYPRGTLGANSFRALDIEVTSDGDAVMASSTIVGLSITTNFETVDSGAPDAHYMMRFNTDLDGDTPDGWFIAANKQAVAAEISAMSSAANAAQGSIKVNIQGTMYYIPLYISR